MGRNAKEIANFSEFKDFYFKKGSGAPEETRTPNPQIRSLVLYPVELRVRLEAVSSSGVGGWQPPFYIFLKFFCQSLPTKFRKAWFSGRFSVIWALHSGVPYTPSKVFPTGCASKTMGRGLWFASCISSCAW